LELSQVKIDDIQREAAASARVIGLAGGLPAEEQFPKRAMAAAFLRALHKRGAPALQYGWVEGSEALREIVAGRLRARGARVRADEVIITSGAQQALALAFDLCCRRGDRVGVSPETYPALLELLRARHLVPVTNSDKPLITYSMPAIGNPIGLALPAAERRDLLTGKGMIVEDDAYADLRFAGPAPRPLLADVPDRVWHVGTFSKTLSPGLRIGWLVPPSRWRKRALRLKQASDLQAGSMAQAILEDYFDTGDRGAPVDFEARLVRLRRLYRRRATALLAGLRAHLPEWNCRAPEGGFAIWAETPVRRGRRGDEIAFLLMAVAAGVVFDPGSLFRPDQAASPLALRLCFSSAPYAALAEGARRLGLAWRRFTRRRSR
jgi:2-aminoadipate transaminase